MYKDRKTGDKTRPTATGNTSNKLGVSSAVTELLEVVSAAESDWYNSISSEDMMAKTREYNEIIKASKKTGKKGSCESYQNSNSATTQLNLT